METGKTGVAGDGLVDLGVVLHRAGAERVRIDVDGVVLLAQPGVVANHVDLADLRPAEMLTREIGGQLGFRHVRLREVDTAPARLLNSKIRGSAAMRWLLRLCWGCAW